MMSCLSLLKKRKKINAENNRYQIPFLKRTVFFIKQKLDTKTKMDYHISINQIVIAI